MSLQGSETYIQCYLPTHWTQLHSQWLLAICLGPWVQFGTGMPVWGWREGQTPMGLPMRHSQKGKAHCASNKMTKKLEKPIIAIGTALLIKTLNMTTHVDARCLQVSFAQVHIPMANNPIMITFLFLSLLVYPICLAFSELHNNKICMKANSKTNKQTNAGIQHDNNDRICDILVP